MKQDAGDGKMKEISDHIYEGALAFLKAEYRLLTFFVIGASLILTAIAFYMDTTYLIVVAFIMWSYIFCICRKHGDENRYKNEC